MTSRVTINIDDGIATVTMDDGKVNAMSAAMLQDLMQAFDEAKQAEAIVVLRGRPGLFSASFDLTTFQQGLEPTVEMMSAGVSAIEQLLTFPHPVVTVCAGHAYPMGAFLMLAADVRFCTDGPWQIGMNEVAIGLTVPEFALELARHRLTPAGVARVATAPMFGPQEAMQLGYVDRVLPADDIEDAVAEEVQRLKGLDNTHFRRTKQRIHEAAAKSIRSAAECELQALSAA